MSNEENHFLPGGNSCRGCGSCLASRLSLEAIYATTKDAMVFGDSCGGGLSELHHAGGLGMESASVSGVDLALKLRGREDKHPIVIAGEGRIAESAFEGLSAAFARRQRITFILMDNEGFSSSGSHHTATTPLGARSPMYPKGKPTPQKNVALMMVFNNPGYVATASPALPNDLQRKVTLAVQNPPSLVQIFCPCITTWGTDPSRTIELSRMAVENGLFPLWEFKDGAFKVTVKPRERAYVGDFLKLQRRYAGISEEEVEQIDTEAQQLYEAVQKMETAFPE
jgi:pyruvate/2-oxoacid:ferredoxin oxidoreductase beta subunit